MKSWTPQQVADAAGARLVAAPPQREGPTGATIDSRQVTDGSLFVGLPGARADGGQFASAALGNGAWGVLVTPEHAAHAARAGTETVLAAADPLTALQRLATAYESELDRNLRMLVALATRLSVRLTG